MTLPSAENLTVEPGTDGFLAPPAVELGQTAGQTIGRYKLLQEIGEGGFGSVWMAEQREPVKRRVALKIIKLGMDTKQVIARFEAERQALAMMDHPHIAKVLDAGATEAGRPFFVMELVKGVPVLEYCDTEKLDTAARLALFAKVCQALQHAHQKGIIHRDVKPSNVLVTLHDGVPVPKVIDFGIAKATNQELTEKTLFTEFRQMIGTPAYMSPEQAEMSGLDVDTRTDIYSLGVLLYELLTGTTPFDIRALLKSGYDEMLRAIREDEPHKPSTRVSTLGETAARTAACRHTDPRRLGTLLRGDLDWIVMKCLEKDRRRRYETASGLADDVLRHLRNEPVLASPPSSAYRLRKFAKRNRRQVIAAGTVAAVLLLGVIGTTLGMLSAREERARVAAQAERASDALRQVTDELAESILAGAAAPAIVPIPSPYEGGEVEALARTAVNLVRRLDAAKEETERELQRATEAKTLIQEMLYAVHPSEARGADTTLLKRILEDAARRLDAGEITDELVEAELQHLVGGTFRRLGELSSAEKRLVRAVDVRRRRLGEEHPDTLSSIQALGSLRLAEDKLPEAEELFREALEGRRRALGDDHADTLSSLNALGVLKHERRELAEAEPLLRSALEAQRRVLGDGHADTLITLGNLAGLLMDTGRLSEAESCYREALEGQRRTLGDDHPYALTTLNNLGVLLNTMGRLAEAEAFYREALERRRRVLGDDHVETLGSLTNVGTALFGQGEFDEAEPFYREALEGCRRVLGPDHRYTLGALNNLAGVLLSQDKLEEAEPYFRRSLDGLRRALGDDHPNTLSAINNLGVLLEEQGKPDEALPLFREALETGRRVLGEDHPWIANRERGLADTLRRLGELDEAVQLARTACERYRAHPDWPAGDADLARKVLADVLAERGGSVDELAER